jgi:TDG/mug DNA glycosylase family protein
LAVTHRPTADELREALTGHLPDILAPNLRVLLVGINPGVYSAAIGHHFGRPGNRFWKVLALAGFTPRQLSPYEDHTLPQYGLGVTNLAARTSARAEELTARELSEGAALLARKVQRYTPHVVAVLGVTAYRTAFQRPKASLGLQSERIAERPLWILPNPSGLNAHHQLPDLARLFAELRAFAFAP